MERDREAGRAPIRAQPRRAPRVFRAPGATSVPLPGPWSINELIPDINYGTDKEESDQFSDSDADWRQDANIATPESEYELWRD